MESTAMPVDHQLEGGLASPPSSENTGANISNPEGFDIMIDALWQVVNNIYTEETKDVKYLNKALYENTHTFIKNKELQTKRKYFKNGRLQSQRQFYFLTSLKYTNRLIPHGETLIFYPNGQLYKQLYFVHGKLHGPFEKYSKHGELLVKYTYNNGKIHGRYLNCEYGGEENSYYNHGVKHGTFRVFDSDGDLVLDRNYIDGKQHGLNKEYYESYLQREEYFKHGVLHGRCTRYHLRSNNIYDITEYKDGKQHGLYRSYDEEGNLYREETFYEGKPHGVSTFWTMRYYGNREVLEIDHQTMYEHGVIHGICRTYTKYGGCIETRYENGVEVSK